MDIKQYIEEVKRELGTDILTDEVLDKAINRMNSYIDGRLKGVL